MKFSAKIYKIGINPYVLLPSVILKCLFIEAGKKKGNIPVKLIINEQLFIQNLVKYSGKWRLYLNTPMRKIAGKDVGDIIEINIEFDPSERITPMHPKLETALQKNTKAQQAFYQLSTSRQKEILRYINFLKTEESVDRNVKRAIGFLTGTEKFVGRDNL
ncbi:MAG TPA: YdeI/OmpD-associated family protein [Parafilimonas sp.]|nr:YdeI/OmpD-associated family protein [Parafilimonas sp.]